MDTRFQRGAAAFNAGRYFVAHEIWEALWNDSVGAQREQLQALIQIAAGYAKVESGIHGGALKLLERGLQRLRHAGNTALGIDLKAFAGGVGADLERVRATPDTELGLDSVEIPALPVEALRGLS